MGEAIDPAAWKALRAPFSEDEIELLPKPTKRENPPGACNKPDRNGLKCGGWHGLPAVHLHYVGHAGVTDRLNEVDPTWTWEPMALTAQGTPLQSDGGMWIRMTVLGVTRIAFGDAGGKSGPNAVKEMIGDAIRNGAMRFGVGTYLWSKSEKAQALAARQDGADFDDPPAPPRQECRQVTESPTPDPAEDGRKALVNEVWQAAKAAGIPWEMVVDDWAVAHDGEVLADSRNLTELARVLDDLAARQAVTA
jgi:hypothetical protein